MYRATVCEYLGAFWLVCFRVAPQTKARPAHSINLLDGQPTFSPND